MSKEVKRYGYGYVDDGNGNRYLGLIEKPDGNLVKHEDYKALLDERDARLLQIDTLAEWYSNSLDVINEITAALPGAHYMDPPDGGDVSVPEQVRRMAKDAERYRWLRIADWWNSQLCVIRDPKQQAKPGTDCPSRDRLDEAIDAALQGEQP